MALELVRVEDPSEAPRGEPHYITAAVPASVRPASREVDAYCRRCTDGASAADAAAETFTVAWRRLDDIPDGEAALGWLHGVARRVLANEFRQTRGSWRLLTRLRKDHPPLNPTFEVVVVRRERDPTIPRRRERLTSPAHDHVQEARR